MNNSYSHIASSIGRFFHLMRYSYIIQFMSYLILVSRIIYISNMIFPSLSLCDKIVWTRIVSLITSLRNKHGTSHVHVKIGETPICEPCLQSSTTTYRGHNSLVIIYCLSFFVSGTSIYMFLVSPIPPPLEIPFHYNIDLLVVSYLFVL